MIRQGWTNEEQLLQHLVFEKKVEEERYLPHGLYSKDGDMFLVYFFNKENCKPWRKKDKYGERYIKEWVTGFDDWKYEYVKMYETLFNLPSAIVFHIEAEDEFVFRPILELGHPEKIDWRDKEFHKDLEKAKGFRYDAEEYRTILRNATDRLFRNRGKRKGMVVWNVEKFALTTTYNRRLF